LSAIEIEKRNHVQSMNEAISKLRDMLFLDKLKPAIDILINMECDFAALLFLNKKWHNRLMGTNEFTTCCCRLSVSGVTNYLHLCCLKMNHLLSELLFDKERWVSNG